MNIITVPIDHKNHLLRAAADLNIAMHPIKLPHNSNKASFQFTVPIIRQQEIFVLGVYFALYVIGQK